MEKNLNKLKFILFVSFISFITSCTTKPQPIKMGDACDFCIMGVADNRFGAELITKKGKIYKFDDIHCLIGFIKEKAVPKEEQKSILFVDFEAPNEFIEADKVFLLKSEDLRSPMGSNIAAFKTLAKVKESQTELGGEEVSWVSLASK